MNRSHLGDALDFWKGRFFQLLDDQLHDLHVFPMFTDENVQQAWTQEHLQCYARLLNVQINHILQSNIRFEARTRHTYFSNLLHLSNNADIFVDPDTGIEPPSGGSTEHIRFAEISQLLPQGSSRVVLVYQHSPRRKDWAVPIVRYTSQNLQGCGAFAYSGVSVGMIFIARDQDRLQQLRNHLVTILQPVEKCRVTRLVIRPVRDKQRQERLDRTLEEINRKYGRALKKLAE